MSLTIYSLMMAVLWFDIFVLLGCLLQRRFCLFINYNLYPVLFLVVLSLIRLFMPVETPFTTVIRSWVIFPAIQTAARTEFVGGITVFEAVALASPLIAAVLLVRLCLAYQAGYREANSYPETDDRRLRRLMDRVAQKTKPGQPYRLCVLDRDVPPSICGLRRPTILLPVSVLAMSDADIRYILMHEWRHHVEKDLWIKLLIEIICCIIWWNPVAYLLKRDTDQTFELKCDLRTAGHLGESDRLDYLDTLMLLSRMQVRPAGRQPAKICFTGQAANIEQRFRAVIMSGKRNRKVEAVSYALLTLLFLASFGFVVQPCYAPPMGDLIDQIDPSVEVATQFSPTPGNAYILERNDGSVWLCVDGCVARPLSPEELQHGAHKNLPIIKEEKE